VTKRIRPSTANNELRCPFGFSLYWDGEEEGSQDCAGSWYFCAEGTGCKFDQGHENKMSQDVKLSYLTVPHAELAYARECMPLNSEPAFVQAMITECTRITLFECQLRCASRAEGSTKAAGEDIQRSPAERLVNYLQNEESLDFILLVHENTATRLLAISRGTTELNEYCSSETDANTMSYA
jgi:hypothetical protein